MPHLMHIGASAALVSPKAGRRSAEEWISAETSRVEAAPEPEATVEAEPASAVGSGLASSAFFELAPIPIDSDSISTSSSSPDSSTGAYERVSSWRSWSRMAQAWLAGRPLVADAQLAGVLLALGLAIPTRGGREAT